MSEASRDEEAILLAYVHDVARRVTQGDERSLDALLPQIYDELRVLATYALRGEREAATLRPTALAHEAYLRLAAQTRFTPRDGGHLLAVASQLMRRVLVDHARERRAQKRGGGAVRVSLGPDLAAPSGPDVDLLDLDAALGELEAVDPRKARVVEMLYFAGYTLGETAATLEVSTKTVQRDWEFARAWLFDRLGA